MARGGKESCIESVASVMLKPLPPHDCSSEPSEQSLDRSHTQPFGMHCSPLRHKNSLLGQKVFFTKKEGSDTLSVKQKAQTSSSSNKSWSYRTHSLHNNVEMMTYDNDSRPRPIRRCSPFLDRIAIASVCNARCCTGTDLDYKYFLKREREIH